MSPETSSDVDLYISISVLAIVTIGKENTKIYAEVVKMFF